MGDVLLSKQCAVWNVAAAAAGAQQGREEVRCNLLSSEVIIMVSVSTLALCLHNSSIPACKGAH